MGKKFVEDLFVKLLGCVLAEAFEHAEHGGVKGEVFFLLFCENTEKRAQKFRVKDL